MKVPYSRTLRPAVLLVSLLIASSDSPLAAPQLIPTAPVRTSATALGASLDPVLAAGGTVAVFVSAAPNLVTNDANGALLDVFVRDLTTESLRLVSVSTHGSSGNGRSHSPAVSADGRLVVFVSEASDLVEGDTNQASDVFVRDLSSGTTRLVSVALDGAQSGAGASFGPVPTPDGRFIAFESWATNLVALDTNPRRDVFLRDLELGVTHWISQPSTNPPAPTGQPPAQASSPVVGEDGSRVVFLGNGGQLARPPRNHTGPLYLRDLKDGTLRMIELLPVDSVSPTVTTVANPALSADGRWLVAYLQLPIFLQQPSGIHRINLETGTVELVATNLDTQLPPGGSSGYATPAIAPDGRTVIFEGQPTALGTRLLPAVYSGAPGSPPVLLSTNLAWIPQRGHAAPVGRLLAASPSTDFVAFAAYAPLPEGATNNGPFHLWVIHRPSGETRRINPPAPNTDTPDRASDPGFYDLPAVSFSADGRRLVFATADPNLIADDLNAASDVFLYDWDTRQLDCLSLRSDLLPSSTEVIPGILGRIGVSADGRWFATTRSDSPAEPRDRNGAPDIYLLDPVTGSNRWVTVRADGQGPANGASWEPSLSADGRWLAFTSVATDLTTPSPAKSDENIYLVDVTGGERTWVTRTNVPVGIGRWTSNQPKVSPDGRRIAFSSTAQLVPIDRTSFQDVYVFERETSEFRLVSVAARGTTPGSHASGNPRWTPDGRWLVFQSLAVDLTTNLLGSTAARWYAWDSTTRRTILVGPESPFTSGGRVLSDPDAGAVLAGDSRTVAFPETVTRGAITVRRLDDPTFSVRVAEAVTPRLDGSGRLLAYRDNGFGADRGQIKVLDLDSGTTRIGSLGLDQQPSDTGATGHELSADGRFLFFVSSSANLHPSASNGVRQLFARDLQAGTTLLLSRNAAGQPADSKAFSPTLMTDGRALVYSTAASNLDPTDFNDAADLYLVRIDDAGAAPVLVIRQVTSASVTLTWATSPNTTDRIEFQEDLGSAAWTRLDVPVGVDGGQASAQDAVDHPQPRRFYRVVRE